MDGKSVELSQLRFDPWLTCEHPAIEALVAEAVKAGEAKLRSTRVRRRRDTVRNAFRCLAMTLVANAAYALALGLEPPTVGISLAKPSGKRSRYDGPSLRQIDSVLVAVEPRLVTITRSRRKGIASVLLAGEGLADCIAGLADFGYLCFRQIGGETIVVHRVERDFASASRFVADVEYEDGVETRRLRAEVERINTALEAADLSFVGGHPVDTRQRQLRRIFSTYDDTPRFDLYGRLNGGWWQNLEREERPGIRIDGQSVADLDFNAMFLRLAYARAGAEPPSGDLYAGILCGTQEPVHRQGAKQVVNAMLSRVGPLQRLPKGCKELLPKGTKAASIREAILERHALIRDQFECGAAASLTRTESDILVAVLLRLIDLGVVALPMHDGLMVRQDNADTALRVMREASREVTGVELPAKVTPLWEE